MKQDGELVELISEAELLAATRIDRDTLRRVRRWLFWEPVREFPGRGSKSYYPAYAVPMIRRFQELRRATRKIDECVWQLWIEKFEFDIRKWAAARLADMEKAARKLIADRDDAAKGAMDLASTSPKRTSGRRSFHSRVRQSEEFTLLLWAFDVLSGRPPV